MEPRFFLPAHVLVYMLVCFGLTPLKSLFSASTTRRAAIASAYVAFVALCLTASLATVAQRDDPRPSAKGQPR